jgi:hypothetical protein
MATVIFYGPDLSRASKVAVGIVKTEGGSAEDLQAWHSESIDVRHDPAICQEILEFIARHDVRSITMADQIMGCPHQEGIDYEGQWCPVCDFWKGRDRFTGKRLS